MQAACPPPPPADAGFRRKRHAPIPPPFHRVLRGQNGQRLRVRLAPAAEADTCPLTMGPAAEDELDFLPGVSYLPGLPHVRLMTLPCRHSFGAMSLVYHFARQNMLCPCCRRGVDAPIAAASIPQHFRAALTRRVDEAARDERRELMEADADAARELQDGEGPDPDPDRIEVVWGIVGHPVFLLAPPGGAWGGSLEMVHRVGLTVTAHAAGADLFSAEFQLTSVAAPVLDDLAVDTPLRFEMPFGEHRRLAAFALDAGPGAVSVRVHANSVANRPVRLAGAGPVPLLCPEDLRAGHGRDLRDGASVLHLRHAPDTGALTHVGWTTPARAFLPLLDFSTG